VIIKIITGLENRVEDLSETLKETRNLKRTRDEKQIKNIPKGGAWVAQPAK